ncbi:hypothetical protein QF034_002684 [Streptomyces africanus]|uniref:Uncharacterized protein n=1 Tax=Streptomyces africanus TaxID=231024 RepID=A0ABU0QM54_9ACTN|nr:hypothetical protein [Streptomyces africanus]
MPSPTLGFARAGGAPIPAGLGEDVGGGELGGAGDAEVDDAGAVVGEHHVGRLQIAVDDSGAVHVAQRLGQAGGDFAQAGQWERAVLADVGAEVRARYVERGHPGARRVGVGVHDGSREGAADLAGCGHLAAMGVPPARAEPRAWGRARNSSSSAYWPCTTLIARGRPEADRAR